MLVFLIYNFETEKLQPTYKIAMFTLSKLTVINDVKEQNLVFANEIKPQTQRSSVCEREGRGDNSNPNFIINTGSQDTSW